MTARTFNIGHHIWFVLHCDENNQIVALEEHDWREGGHLPRPEDGIWENLFLREVANRIAPTYEARAEMIEEAKLFIKSTEKEKSIFRKGT